MTNHPTNSEAEDDPCSPSSGGWQEQSILSRTR